MKLAYAKTKDDADRQVKVAQVQSQHALGTQKVQTEAQSTMAEVQGRQQEHSAKIYEMNLDAQNEQQEHAMSMQETAMKARMDMQKHELAQQTAQRRASQMDQQMADRCGSSAQFKPPGGLV